ncbi:uncharacterized protein LOC117342283 [Pecten maximus]|uniref:uncharacterized protein LOC117342283 n=1 Tax=Pecten maximus TaxID=6579 RepID=UPI00145864D7|nr:uncharacterized protein LOC117342283 [Pecten maximus]
MELYKSVLLCVLAVVLLADVFTATPITSRHSRQLRSNHHFRVEQDIDEAFSILEAENAFNSRMHRGRNANRRRRSFPNETVMAFRHCFNQLMRARRRNPRGQLSERCERVLRPYSRSSDTVIIIEK